MLGETSLNALLRGLSPTLNPGEYVFCTVSDERVLQGTRPLGSFQEREGLTVILERPQADRLQLPYTYVAAWITISIHSALEAVGLTAALSTALAQAGISCNVVAGFYHDHLFVSAADGSRALQVLRELAAQ
ncbi:hypothetical protein SAMN05444354_112170 [Stigmatella aurantiaca]|uniref:Uncharacterized protein n=1 Tax=Stigmatella aurantiaca TaxID=41 RepID=A0A1H7W630_STIAU|nr:ACT domain-containing protein [Stigmatella aurantiaca]SEM16976.1 hypothetical protein SAMN05444354_112170 [Stigmatella aurantiaca]